MKILVTADWHVKGERPVCRTDENWIESQRETIQEIRRVFEENNCEQIWILGDLFDAPRCSTSAVNMLIEELKKFPPNSVKILCGNHDLKDHNYGNLYDCSIGIVKQFFGDVPDKVFSMLGRCYDVSAKPFGLDDYEEISDVVCTHQLTFPNEAARPMPDCGVLAADLLDAWKTARVIFTGDYHHAFIYEDDYDKSESRFVATPGCINIQKADELDYVPSVIVWNTELTSAAQFQKFFLNPQKENCTRDHIEFREQKESQLSAVVETIKGGVEITLDFDSNLENAVKKTDAAIIEEYSIMRQELNGESK